MRGNTNPCSICEYCDDSCDVCLHQPYEHSNAALYCEASSCDEAEAGYASTDVDTDSDEDGSWFTTPWSKLITKRVAGYEVDPEIGVQLTPIEPDQNEEEKEERDQEGQARKQEKHRRKQEKEQEVEEGRGGRRRRLRRRRRRDSPAAVESTVTADGNTKVTADGDTKVTADGDTKLTADGETKVTADGDTKVITDEECTEGSAQPANDEARAEFSESSAEPAKNEVQDQGEAVPKDAHNNTWRESVQSCIPLVSAS